MVTRVDPFLGGLGIDATGKFEVQANATVTVGDGTSTGNVIIGGELVASTVSATTYTGLSANAITSSDTAVVAIDPNVTIVTDGTERVRVDSSGNVGIGTSSPSQKLTIEGTDARIYLTGANTDIDMTGNADGQLSLDGNGYAFGIALNSSGANLYTNSASRDLIFGVNETEIMRITDSRVGIGTSGPGGDLHIQGVAGDSVRLYLTDGDATGVTNSLLISKSGSTSFVSDRQAGSSLWFGTAETERMRIDSSGNVGIGESSPDTLLHVTGTSSTAIVRLESTSSGATSFDGSGTGLELTAYGMNTTNKYTPAIKFGSTDPHLTTTNPKFGAAIIAEAVQAYATDTNGGMDLSFWTSPADPGTGHGLVQRMVIQQGGNVGIGTASPSTIFHIDDNTAGGTGLLVTGGGSGLPLATFTRDVGGTGTVKINSSGNDPQIVFEGTNTFAVGADGSSFKISDNAGVGTNDRLTIDSSGNVGIGNTAPSYLLDLYKLASTVARIRNSAATGGTPSVTHGEFVIESTDANMGMQFLGSTTADQRILFSDTAAASGQIVYNHTSNYMALFTNGGERMRIDSSGNVGIGTTSPSAPGGSINLLVNGTTPIIKSAGTTTARYDLSTTTSNSYSIISLNDNSGSPYLQLTSGSGVLNHYYDGPTHIWRNTAGTERMRIDSSGNVGIGTSTVDTALGTKLHVAGTIRTDTGSANANPAIVFDHDNFGDADANYIMLERTTEAMRFNVNAAERMRIDSSGNINVATGKLQEGGNALIPAGSIIMYGAAAAPGGWLLCEGGAISRSTYAALFSAIGTTYGAGDGSTTFNVPDFRDRAPYGASTFTLGSKTAGEVNASGQNSTGTGTSGSSGATTVANTTGAGGAHTPGVTTSTTNSTTDKDVTNSITVVTAVSAVADHTHSIPSLTVNGHTHSVPALTVTHPGVAVKFIIKT